MSISPNITLSARLVTISERTGLSSHSLTDDVLNTGLVEMQELPELVKYEGEAQSIGPRGEHTGPAY